MHKQLLKALTFQACLPCFYSLAVVTYSSEQLGIFYHPSFGYATFSFLVCVPVVLWRRCLLPCRWVAAVTFVVIMSRRHSARLMPLINVVGVFKVAGKAWTCFIANFPHYSQFPTGRVQTSKKGEKLTNKPVIAGVQNMLTIGIYLLLLADVFFPGP
ncbi:unnamed protein product [Caenorhabditis auriculariae]|uniref:Uncharacterized protein n=1 Tax=Caenorhabditis auriculariae TaxID=2777116 RepID=A0A8S1GUW3_9PELO|nr:unnamed protein product [Caenorhabditis auriculariae]